MILHTHRNQSKKPHVLHFMVCFYNNQKIKGKKSACLILLILCRESLGQEYDPMYVHKVPLVDTQVSHSVQPEPRFFSIK